MELFPHDKIISRSRHQMMADVYIIDPINLYALLRTIACAVINAGLILGLRPANERRRYFVTTSLINWAQAYNRPCNVSLQSVSLDGRYNYSDAIYMSVMAFQSNVKSTVCSTVCSSHLHKKALKIYITGHL